jgi:hypothetical protein
VHYGVTPLARRQLADKLKIPYAYFERMREDQPALLDRNVNTWLQSEDERRMLRTLDGQVRAVLSDRYRRLDNFDLAESVLPILQQLPEVRFESVELTETKHVPQVHHAQAEVRDGAWRHRPGRRRDLELRGRPGHVVGAAACCSGWCAATG